MEDRMSQFAQMLQGDTECDDLWYNEKLIMEHIDLRTPVVEFDDVVHTDTQCTNGPTCAMLCDFDHSAQRRMVETIQYYEGVSSIQPDSASAGNAEDNVAYACFPTTIAAYACVVHLMIHHKMIHMLPGADRDEHTEHTQHTEHTEHTTDQGPNHYQNERAERAIETEESASPLRSQTEADDHKGATHDDVTPQA